MELPKYINLDYLLSVKYTRVVDVSNCVSLNGFIFVIDTKEILHKKKIELCISRRIGVKARFNDIAVLHRGLYDGERYDEWRRI